jgi:hypothetical protein
MIPSLTLGRILFVTKERGLKQLICLDSVTRFFIVTDRGNGFELSEHWDSCGQAMDSFHSGSITDQWQEMILPNEYITN